MNKIEYLEFDYADEIFSQKEKKLFLQIPNKKTIIDDTLEVIDFNVPENGKYHSLRNVKLINVLKELDESNGINMHLYGTTNRGEMGLFIDGKDPSLINSFIRELYKYNQEDGEKLLNEYLNKSMFAPDAGGLSVNNRFVIQSFEMLNYLNKEKIEYKNYNIDYKKLCSLEEEDFKKEFSKLEAKYDVELNMVEDFESYNDLDYLPMILEKDYCIYDFSSTNFYVFKPQQDEDGSTSGFKIYFIRESHIDKDYFNEDYFDYLNDFSHSHGQRYFLLKEKINESHLIGEIKDGKLVKASSNLLTLDLLQDFICEVLVEKGVFTVPLEKDTHSPNNGSGSKLSI